MFKSRMLQESWVFLERPPKNIFTPEGTPERAPGKKLLEESLKKLQEDLHKELLEEPQRNAILMCALNLYTPNLVLSKR